MKSHMLRIDFACTVNPNEAVGNLLFSGATASVKGSALFASFSASKFALRSLSQSLAREWGPKGVHVSVREPNLLRGHT